MGKVRKLFGFQQLIGAVKTVGLVLFFYTFSISLTFYNKWMMKRFHFPLSISVVHYTFVFILASMARFYWELKTGKKRIILSWSDYLKRVLPTAMAAALDIGLSNWSFIFITISLYTMTKSTSIIFILIFALIFRIEKWHISLLAIVLLISGGLFMFTYQSTQFNTTGFFICLIASVISGVRWTLAQIIMQKDSLGLHNPIDTIYHLQPLMVLTLAPLAFYMEGHRMVVSDHLFNAAKLSIALESALMVLLGCLLAFMLSVSEFLLLAHTSSLTLSISGIFKEVCTLSLAAEFVGDRMNPVNFVGLILCLSGIGVHVVTKATKDSSDKESMKVKYEGEAVRMLPMSQDNDDDDDDIDEYELNTKYNGHNSSTLRSTSNHGIK